ncbi:uncharacterized protein LOC120477081 isoform X3 [Pimephales promelas]|uniref:uncharacterized protein LOC120477081 isoform X3 n=1 Tax=Pimephales promelas TaxID=90988 RepID=UPI0019559303|nr:uncharacterized protein LOC120477081 isoform X3 [Pimephales promelas]
MNWVGGTRSRFMKNKEDTIKQRAFFQRQRMKIKSNIMDSTKGQNSGNMDLLTLFIVNQIASKKEKTAKPKTNLSIVGNRTKKALNEPLELPMSPCTPSKLDLVTSQTQHSVDTPVFKIRKHRLAEKFKVNPLSPVFESNLSDASGSENQPSSTLNGSTDPFQPKPTPHVPSFLPSRENPDNKTPQYVSFSQPTKLNNPWTIASNEAPEQDLPHNSPVVGIQFESTLPNPEMDEDSVTSGFYPLSSDQPEEPLFIDFKNRDCEVLSTMNSSDRSQNMYNEEFSTQKFGCTDSNTSGADGRNVFVHGWESPRGVYLGLDDEEEMDLPHAEDSLIAKHCCDCKLSKCKDPPITLNKGTQTEALSNCDVSVQCSPIHPSKSVPFPTADQKTNVPITRQQSFHFNQILNRTTLSSPEDGHKRTGNSPSEASAANQPVQRHPESQADFHLRKLRSRKSTERDVTPNLKQPLRKASEQKIDEMWRAKVKLARCDSPRLESVTRNPVKDVKHAGEPVKKKKKFTTEKGVNWASEETKKQEAAEILLTLKDEKD